MDAHTTPSKRTTSPAVKPASSATVGEGAARELVVLILAASAAVHVALAPAHAAEGTGVAVAFAVAAAALAITAVWVNRSRRPAPYALAALLLGCLLAAYAASRLTVLWPLGHAERVDALGAATKLFEAAGLLLALRLLRTPAGSARAVRPTQGAGP